MKLTLKRETLLKPLQFVTGVVETRQTMPILSNVLIRLQGQVMTLIATDTEVEIRAQAPLEQAVDPFEITAPAQKLMDICRNLPEEAEINISVEPGKMTVRSGRSRFILATLPADGFPHASESSEDSSFTIAESELRTLLQRTQFAMAQQDVRFYLNGLLLEVNEGVIRAVATDGHRLALHSMASPVVNNAMVKVIIPRKGVLELMRLLGESSREVKVSLSNNHIRVDNGQFIFISKLVDGSFPDYNKVIPKNGDKVLYVDRDYLKQTLTRVCVIATDAARSVRMELRKGTMRLLAYTNNEEAEEILEFDYNHEDMDVGFNATYLLDILNTVGAGKVKFTFQKSDSSVLVEEPESAGDSLYVVMPVKL